MSVELSLNIIMDSPSLVDRIISSDFILFPEITLVGYDCSSPETICICPETEIAVAIFFPFEKENDKSIINTNKSDLVNFKIVFAERAGFEPAMESPPYTLSKRAP